MMPNSAPYPLEDPGPLSRFLTLCAVLPAVLALALLLTAGIAYALHPMPAAPADYGPRAARALRDGDFETARICYERLLQQRPGDLPLTFGLMLSLHGLRQEAAADALLRDLAPERHAVFAPAHLLVAEALLKNGDAPAPQREAAAEQQLLRVLELAPDNDEAHALLAMLYARAGRWVAARQQLAAVRTAAVEELRLSAAELAAARGLRDEARLFAAPVAIAARSRLKRDRGDVAARLAYARALTAGGEFGEAVALLHGGLGGPNAGHLLAAIATVYARWADASTSAAARVMFNLAGVCYDPSNAELIGRVKAWQTW
jgi:hypothetical protein